MLREEWTKEQILEAVKYIKDNYIFVASKYPGNVKHNKNIFFEINKKYENMFCNVLEIYKLINDEYKYLLFCPICGKRNGFLNDHCSCSCTQLDKKVRNKYKQTNLLRHGNENYNNVEKNKQTCLKKYGCINVFQNEEIKNKSKKTKLKKYNNEKYINIEKQIKTKLNDVDNNGLNVYKRATLKAQETMLERYGVKTPMEKEEFKENYEKSMLKKYGVKQLFSLSSVRKLRKKTNTSNLEKEWLNNMDVKDCKENRQVFLNNMFLDGFQNNIIYEFLGDYWHGNPISLNRYKKDIREKYKKFFNENFEKTQSRFNKLYEAGYKIYYCWENDFKKDKFYYRKYRGKLEY